MYVEVSFVLAVSVARCLKPFHTILAGAGLIENLDQANDEPGRYWSGCGLTSLHRLNS